MHLRNLLDQAKFAHREELQFQLFNPPSFHRPALCGEVVASSALSGLTIGNGHS
jgi:hypothetical protein